MSIDDRRPAPDGWEREAPAWRVFDGEIEVTVWPDGVDVNGELFETEERIAELERDARKVLAAAAWYRRTRDGGRDR